MVAATVSRSMAELSSPRGHLVVSCLVLLVDCISPQVFFLVLMFRPASHSSCNLDLEPLKLVSDHYAHSSEKHHPVLARRIYDFSSHR